MLLIVDGVWVGLRTARNLETARDEIRTAADAVLNGQVDEATTGFDEAKAAADAAGQLSAHPAGMLAETLPWIGDDVHAVDDLAQAAALTAQAGQTLMAAAQRVGWDGTGVPGVTGSGLSTQVLDQIAPEVGNAHDDLLAAQDVLQGISTGSLLPPVEDAVLTARGELAGRTELLGSASDIANLVPSVLRNGERYLLIIQNPGEVRGTGGFMGFFGTLESDGKQLQLTTLFPTADAPTVPAVHASTDFKARYARFQSLVDIRQANFSPDLPSTAGVVTQMSRELGWGRFDGIFLVDTIWMKYMLEATGPITAPGWDGQIATENVVDVLGRELPALPSEKSNTIQASIGHAVWEAIQTADLSPSSFATALARSVNERHMQLWFADPAQEALAENLRASGEATLGPNPIYVAWNAVSASKVAIFTERSTGLDVTLDAQGSATVTETLKVTNAAPIMPPASPADLLGTGNDFPVGTFAAYASVYLPARIEGSPAFASSAPTVSGIEEEFGHKVAVGFLQAPAGGEMTWQVTYRVPDAVTRVDGVREYRLDFLPQPTFRPGQVSVTIHLPEGAVTSDRSPGVSGGNGTIEYHDRPAVPTVIWVRY